MATLDEEAPVMVGAGEKEEVVAAPEKVGEVKEAGAGEEEMEVAVGEAKKAEGDGEKVDEAKEAGAGEDGMEVAGGDEAKKAEEGSEAKTAEGDAEKDQEQGKAKKPRSRKPRSAAPHHPPYFQMIKEAITAAGDGKAGASAYAIAKRVGERYGEALPGNYRKVLAAQLRGFTAKGRLVRVKASFRLAPAEEEQAASKPKSTAKKAASKKAAPAQARGKRGAKKAGPPTA